MRRRWGTFIITFGMICSIWLAHYRIFRRRFVAQMLDVVANFIFLFGIAVLPYAVQTFLRFSGGRDAIILYFGDFALIFTALATLRCSALRQRRGDDGADARLREWRATLRQYIVVLIVVAFLLAMNTGVVAKEKLYVLVPAALLTVTLLTRLAIRRLPSFLQ